MCVEEAGGGVQIKATLIYNRRGLLTPAAAPHDFIRIVIQHGRMFVKKNERQKYFVKYLKANI